MTGKNNGPLRESGDKRKVGMTLFSIFESCRLLGSRKGGRLKRFVLPFLLPYSQRGDNEQKEIERERGRPAPPPKKMRTSRGERGQQGGAMLFFICDTLSAIWERGMTGAV